MKPRSHEQCERELEAMLRNASLVDHALERARSIYLGVASKDEMRQIERAVRNRVRRNQARKAKGLDP